MTGRRPRLPEHVLANYGLLVVAAGLFLLFSLLRPDTFPTWDNVRSITSDRSVSALLALGATLPIATGRFDLSIGYGLGLEHVVVVYLQVHTALPWQVVVLLVLLLGALIGMFNGLLVELAQIDSFIATLGSGSLLYAAVLWLSGGAEVTGALPVGFTDIFDSRLLGLPAPFWYVVAATILLWLLMGYTPVGRYLYVIGANPRAAAMTGIHRTRYVVLAFVGSGFCTAAAAVLYASEVRIGNPSIGLEFLLPAFAGVLLGTTAINAGRPNPLGTIVAVATLAIGVAGVLQLNGAFWVTPLINGLTLLLAVGLAGYTTRRRAQGPVYLGGGGS